MSYLQILILICFLSLAGIGAILALGFYSIRKLDKKYLYEGVVCGRPFFVDFYEGLRPYMKTLSCWGARHFSFLSKKVNGCGVKKYYCSFSDYVQGRQSIVKNGCKGYWGKLNGKKEKTEDTN